MIRVGVVGYGYWGPNLARNFAAAEGCLLAAIADPRAERRAEAARRHPTVPLFPSGDELIASAGVDAVAIATPVSNHFSQARRALDAGKHVLLEKPFVTSRPEALELMELAAARRCVLMVGHTFVYSDAVKRIREMVTSGSLGELHYYDAARLNLGVFQHDVNVLWDLAVHDLSIVHHVTGFDPVAVSASGSSHIAGSPQNIAYLTLLFDRPFLAHIHANWLAPVKVRRTLIGGSQRMIVYDDLEPSEKVKVYDRGIELGQHPEDPYRLLVGYRAGDMWAPQLELKEALRTEVEHFAACIADGAAPITGGEAGLWAVEILEAAERSLAARGAPVELRLGTS